MSHESIYFGVKNANTMQMVNKLRNHSPVTVYQYARHILRGMNTPLTIEKKTDCLNGFDNFHTLLDILKIFDG